MHFQFSKALVFVGGAELDNDVSQKQKMCATEAAHIEKMQNSDLLPHKLFGILLKTRKQKPALFPKEKIDFKNEFRLFGLCGM